MPERRPRYPQTVLHRLLLDGSARRARHETSAKLLPTRTETNSGRTPDRQGNPFSQLARGLPGLRSPTANARWAATLSTAPPIGEPAPHRADLSRGRRPRPAIET